MDTVAWLFRARADPRNEQPPSLYGQSHNVSSLPPSPPLHPPSPLQRPPSTILTISPSEIQNSLNTLVAHFIPTKSHCLENEYLRPFSSTGASLHNTVQAFKDYTHYHQPANQPPRRSRHTNLSAIALKDIETSCRPHPRLALRCDAYLPTLRKSRHLHQPEQRKAPNKVK